MDARLYERLFIFILLIPTMIYVVGMGYTRQSVSIGFLCFAIYYWSENMNVKKNMLPKIIKSS